MRFSRPFVTLSLIAFLVSLVVLCSSLLRGQSASVQAPRPKSLAEMEAAGIKMSFDVASVKPNKSDEPRHSNVPLLPGDPSRPVGGYLSATNFPFVNYIWFAYDLGQVEMVKLASQLPRWATSESRFDIQARAQGNPTRAQMQLMMQSLLADRFKLALHTETKQGPIYALVLAKPGKLGPHIRQHTDDASCSTGPLDYGPGQLAYGPRTVMPVPSRASALDLPPLPCGVISKLTPSAPGLVRFGGRGIRLIDFIKYTSLDRTEIDRTGLSGTFDFDCEVALPPNGPSEPQSESTGETLHEAMQDQLGLKLETQTGPVTTYILDHIEEPSPN